jgi:hypothetical protein
MKKKNTHKKTLTVAVGIEGSPDAMKLFRGGCQLFDLRFDLVEGSNGPGWDARACGFGLAQPLPRGICQRRCFYARRQQRAAVFARNPLAKLATKMSKKTVERGTRDLRHQRE